MLRRALVPCSKGTPFEIELYTFINEIIDKNCRPSPSVNTDNKKAHIKWAFLLLAPPVGRVSQLVHDEGGGKTLPRATRCYRLKLFFNL